MSPASDSRWMRRAIALSRRGFPAPNPHVGCVIVRDDAIVGEGYHDARGGPHAEVVALRMAGDRAKLATAFVTLEPCAHHGRTPPCTEALIAAGVRRVVFAVPDPNPKASGGGEALVRAGIAVESGLEREAATEANRAFLTAMRRSRPFVAVKVGASLDGRIALPSGESQWITGEKARAAGRRLRAEYGAVLVGRRTVELDNPLLTHRVRAAKNPSLRLVLDPRGRLDPNRHRLFQDGGPVARLVGLGHARAPFDVELDAPTGRFDPTAVLAWLWDQGMTQLLVEGGGDTIGGFLAARVVDRIELFLGPKVLGAGPNWVQRELAPTLGQLPPMRIARVRRLDGDLHVTIDVET